MNEFKDALKQLKVFVIIIIGIIGGCLVMYSFIVQFTEQNWAFINGIAPSLTIYTTLGGTLLIALSVYLPINTRKADALSKYFTSPAVSAAILVILIYNFFFHYTPSPHIINGFGIMAISGSLLRMTSR